MTTGSNQDAARPGPSPRVLGALLAGGESKRFGSDKAAYLFDGRTLAERALAVLAEVCHVTVVVGHGRGVPPGVARVDDAPVAGASRGAGPLAGIAAALRVGAEQGAELVLILPLDMPAMEPALLRRLIAHAAGVGAEDAGAAGAAGASFLGADGRIVPLPICLLPSHGAQVEQALAAGQRSLLGLMSRVGMRLVRLRDDEMAALVNVNVVVPPADAPAMAGTSGAAERVAARRLRRGQHQDADDWVAREAPLQILLGPLPLAVLMRTPGHDPDLVRGFLLTERIAATPDEIARVEHCDEVELDDARGNVVRATLRDGVRVDPGQLQRSTYVGSSCGICGKASVTQAMATAPPIGGRPPWPAAVLEGLGDRLAPFQALFAQTGGSHGAALFDEAGRMVVVREDVGRHNATDKVIGAAAAGAADRPWPCAGLGLLVSGRISFELVQKALAAGIDLVVGVSAPTSLAIELGEAAGVCVVGFCRGHRATVFSARHRVTIA